MDDSLRRWVEATTGGELNAATRLLVGGSRDLWLIEVDERPLVLRAETGAGAFAGTPLTLQREAMVCRSLRDSDVPVADVLAVASDLSAVLMTRLPGTSDIRRLDPEHVAAVTTGFMEALAALHRLDPATLDLPGLPMPRSSEDHALWDLDLWEDLIALHLPAPDPLVSFASAWLRAHPPTEVQRTVLVQGDTGPGNFLFDGPRVTGLVDWEMSHLGDPMDDIAWLDMRSAGGPLGDLAARDAAYERASGLTIDGRSVAYYRVFVFLRCAVITGIVLSREAGALGTIAYRAPHHRFLLQLAGALGEVLGVDLEGIARPREMRWPSSRDGRGRSGGPSSSATERLAARAEKLRREHAFAVAELGEELRASDRADRASTLGAAITEPELSAEAAAGGVDGSAELLGYLFRRAQRLLVPWATPGAGEDIVPKASPRAES